MSRYNIQLKMIIMGMIFFAPFSPRGPVRRRSVPRHLLGGASSGRRALVGPRAANPSDPAHHGAPAAHLLRGHGRLQRNQGVRVGEGVMSAILEIRHKFKRFKFIFVSI